MQRLRLVPAAFAIAVMAFACAQEPLRPAPHALDNAPPELIDGLRSDPFVYFRLINRPWISRVCDAFAGDTQRLPTVRLHGDAHLEQFAFTNEAWGLDDFDDSAEGPALIDIVRFIGSLDLAVRQRSWETQREALVDRFFEGYRRGVADPDYVAPEPGIVGRLRSHTPVTRAKFLARGEALMRPMSEASLNAIVTGMEAFAQFMSREHPDLSPAYFQVTRAGWLRIGVGSAATPKVLLRVRGPSSDPDDDELLEIKAIGDLGSGNCVHAPTLRPTLRVIDGTNQLGRLKHKILAAWPDLVIPGIPVGVRPMRGWWIRNWDYTYREVALVDLQSADDLAAIAFDAGVQLAQGSLQERNASVREQTLASIPSLQNRLRKEASALIGDVLREWRQLGGDRLERRNERVGAPIPKP
jgi:hypothetical protein